MLLFRSDVLMPLYRLEGGEGISPTCVQARVSHCPIAVRFHIERLNVWRAHFLFQHGQVQGAQEARPGLLRHRIPRAGLQGRMSLRHEEDHCFRDDTSRGTAAAVQILGFILFSIIGFHISHPVVIRPKYGHFPVY